MSTSNRSNPRRRLLAAAFGMLVASMASGAAAQAETRLALVIGNSAYKSSPLKNPVNDARAMAEGLRAVGFEVIARENTTFRDLIEAMRQFSVRAPQAQVRLLFFAGHGVQVKGRNYLVPIDTDIKSEDEVAARSADVNELLERLGQSKQGVNVVILDACRTNPFTGNDVVLPDGRRLKYRSIASQGLAPMDAPLGTLVAFSTAPGGVALDNPDAKNSTYTRALLANLAQPGLPIEQLFKRVRIAVSQETGRLQIPWESSSLVGEFCFRVGPGGRCAGG